MLSYLAAALPPEIGAATRLLAVQCALRTTSSGRLWVPAGLLRGMRIQHHSRPWWELEQSGWLVRLATTSTMDVRYGVSVQLLDASVLAQAPGRLDRAHAADTALRLAFGPVLRDLSVSDQLAGLTLVTHLPPSKVHGVIEADRLGRVCALAPDLLTTTLDRLVAARAADWWSYDPGSEDITWALGPTLGWRYANLLSERA
ncbi:hypothetical protein [Streptomyces sp. NPDC048611]|uniref:hypothetical protein n=1 Tax=Streptomyces sp. NPDC048611 TaxID=3155635 RepID=UPI0034135A58